MNQQRQPSVSSLQRERPADAPHLTRKHTCSDCSVPAIEAGGGELTICPKCFGVLWHRDWSAEERQRKAAVAAANKAAREEALQYARAATQERLAARNRRRAPIVFRAEDLILSSPTLGTALLGTDFDDD